MERPVHTIDNIYQSTKWCFGLPVDTEIRCSSHQHPKCTASPTMFPFEKMGIGLKVPHPNTGGLMAARKRWTNFWRSLIERDATAGRDREVVQYCRTAQRGQYGMVLPRFIEAAIKGEELLVFGDGSQSRCFCHVSDVVRALIELMSSAECRGEVFNVGSTEEITIRNLAARVIGGLGVPPGCALSRMKKYLAADSRT